MPGFRITTPAYEEHAKAIGHLCNQWATLELFVDFMLASLIPLPYMAPNNDVFNCIAASSDMGSKIQMIRGIAFIRKVPFYDDLMNVLNEVHNKMRLRRNRIVHDVWGHGISGEPQRMQRTISIKKPQAYRPDVLRTFEFEDVGIEDLWDFIKKITDASGYLHAARVAYEHGHPPPAVLQTVFDA